MCLYWPLVVLCVWLCSSNCNSKPIEEENSMVSYQWKYLFSESTLGHPFFIGRLSSPRSIKSKCWGKLCIVNVRCVGGTPSKSYNILQIMVYHTENQDAINQKSIPPDPSQFISIIIRNIFLLALCEYLYHLSCCTLRLWWPALWSSSRWIRVAKWGPSSVSIDTGWTVAGMQKKVNKKYCFGLSLLRDLGRLIHLLLHLIRTGVMNSIKIYFIDRSIRCPWTNFHSCHLDWCCLLLFAGGFSSPVLLLLLSCLKGD